MLLPLPPTCERTDPSHLARPARVLCILDKHPLPTDNGTRTRLWNLVQAVASQAMGTVLVLGGDAEQERTELLRRALPGWQVRTLPCTPHRRSLSRAMRDVGAARLPVQLARRDLRGWRVAVAAELATGYDAVFVANPRAFVLVEPLTDLPLVASIDTVEHLKARDRSGEPRRARDSMRDVADQRSWPRLYARLCERAAVVLVGCEGDRDALGRGRVMVVPNGADVPERLPRRRRRHHPTVLFHGHMTHAPNVDAARYLAEQIVPLVLRRVPDARFRIVGRANPEVLALREHHDAVDVAGYIDDLTPELVGADAAVVPLRVAGGTRVKVLEAFAHGLPVVSTSHGIDGIALTPGRHALIADDARGLADALCTVLRDPSVQESLGAQGRRFVQERYDWTALRHCVGEVVAGVVQGARGERAARLSLARAGGAGGAS